ncbi:VOC family protein [Ferruginibacter sp. SUN106]|uniref:VOC family protein n=1 Tax=Ferruginibacter sp. SUN106 TaxID=2978348 RepID=UPI003D35F8B0
MDILGIEIQTGDLNATASFYADVLGMQLANKTPNAVSFSAGQSTLTFIQSIHLNPTYHFAFNIPHNKLDEAIQWAKAKLSLIATADNGIVADFKSWNAKAIYFYDNNKNIVEFIARFDLADVTDKPFDISSIQSISEIGIVTDAPIVLADQLILNNKLPVFTKGTKSKEFVTLGNDNGLFIIVETNRKWYPTQQQAEKHYTKIKIATGGLVHEIIMNEEYAGR